MNHMLCPHADITVLAHIFGIPVEETALTFAPVLVVFVAGVRAYGHNAHGKLRASGQRGRTSDAPIDSETTK